MAATSGSAAGTPVVNSDEGGPPGGAAGASYFFKDSSFEFTFLIALGSAYYQGADVGKVLHLTRQVMDGDQEGAYGALARGYDVLTFDGPGQGYALWKQGLHFRPDWETVITPVVDLALTLDGVDPARIALLGISQGGYWVPRAVAFEKRIAAGVADPGVVDVSGSWLRTVPPELLALLNSGAKDEFDAVVAGGLPPAVKAGLAFRMRPFGMTSYFDVFTAVQQYRLGDLAGRITCPMLITDPENEAFWPGQSEKLHGLLTGPKTLVRFTAGEGADLHCEPKAAGLRDLRIFDWLDETLGRV